jgi:hypothetical protein
LYCPLSPVKKGRGLHPVSRIGRGAIEDRLCRAVWECSAALEKALQIGQRPSEIPGRFQYGNSSSDRTIALIIGICRRPGRYRRSNAA